METAKQRATAAAAVLLESSADVALLQEFWFEERYRSLLERELTGYKFFYAQRPCRADGVAIAIRKDAGLHVLSSSLYRLSYASSRVALIMKLAEHENSGREFLLCTTHLSFPHGLFTRLIQTHEARNLLRHLDNMAQREIPILLGGDFNSDCESLTYGALESAGYESCYAAVEGDNPAVTHRDHNGKEVLADFLFTKSSFGDTTLSPHSATLLPLGLDADSFPTAERFDVSDHRPLCCDINIFHCVERSSL